MDILDQIALIFADFADPRKRIFVGYLLVSLLIAFAFLIVARRRSGRDALGKVFDRKVFFSGSARADYKIFVINRLVSLLISPLLVTQLAIATAIYTALHGQDWLRPGQWSGLGAVMIVAAFSMTMFVIDDLTKYLVHRWMHRWPILWAIHKVHHSATTLTPVTVYRVHPLEGILYGLRSTVAQGVTLSLFFFAFGDAVDLYTVLGVNVLVFVFHVTGSNLRHSHIDIAYPVWLERILISPAQHQLHHSIAEEHYDRNFGAALAIWDWLFGSLHLSETGEELEFGLLPEERSSDTRLSTLYLAPFREIAGLVARPFQRLRQGGARHRTE